MSKRDEFIIKVLNTLKGEFSTEDLESIESALVETLSDYEITTRVTDVVEYGREVPEWYAIFLAKKRIAGRTMDTLKLYNKQIIDFFRNAPAPLDDMDGTLMFSYLYNYQKRRGVTNRTLDQVRIMLNAFFDWAASEGYIKKNFVASIDPIKYVERPRQPLTEEEVVLVRDACETYRERAIVDVFLYTGVRLSELANMKWSDIDLDKKTITVFGKGSKYRTVLFNSQTKISLLQYKLVRLGDSDRVFLSDKYPYNPINKEGVSAIIRKISSRANISARLTPHVFRHTFATQAIARGMAPDKLQELLGHENYATTQIYVQNDMAQTACEYKRCFA